jgi:hypothetical protein
MCKLLSPLTLTLSHKGRGDLLTAKIYAQGKSVRRAVNKKIAFEINGGYC